MPLRPILLAVVGDSAAGKTTMIQGIATILGAERVTSICIDDYHRYTRAQRRSLAITALHPHANNIDLVEQHLRSLAAGESILKPVYNHQRGDFDPPVQVNPRPFVIVEGLLCLLTPALRDCFHVKVYLDPAEDLRRTWKLQRDCAERGYAPSEVLVELAKREVDSALYIRPQRSWADIVVQFDPSEASVDSRLVDARLTLRPTLPHPNLADVVALSGERPALHLHGGREEGRQAEFLDIAAWITPTSAASVEDAIWSRLPDMQHVAPDQLGTFRDGYEPRQSHSLALTQLLIAYHLLLAHQEQAALSRRAIQA